MKKLIFSIFLLTVSCNSNAGINFSTEILIGKSNNDYYSSFNDSDDELEITGNSDSLALRFGVQINNHFTFEVSMRDYGKVENRFEFRVPRVSPGGGLLPSKYDTIYTAIVPIDNSSVNIGVKGELEIISDLSINAGIGIAFWEYKAYSPEKLVSLAFGSAPSQKDSGNDFYFSFGTQYNLTNDLYMGVEYTLVDIKNSYNHPDSGMSGLYKHFIKDLSLVIGWQF